MTRRLVALVAALAVVALAPARAGTTCVADPLIEGEGHDHAAVSQHQLACGIDLVAYDGLGDLVPEPAMFGEIDVAGDVAVMAIAYPEAGFIVFDVSDPANPVALSRYHGPNCEQAVMDSDCGADVKLHPSGTVAFLAVQNVTRAPFPPTNPLWLHPQSAAAPPEGGIIAVNISIPEVPVIDSWVPLEAFGTHMIAYHEIGGQGYIFAVDNTKGLSVVRVDIIAGHAILTPVLDTTLYGEQHDLFLYDDPVDHKTYLYVAGGRREAVDIYDASDPANLELVGSWDANDAEAGNWYVHSVWTMRWTNGRRYTFVAPELFQGWGNRSVGPVWVVDTTDHAAPFLAGTWKNPGNHWGRNLGFSPHNVWMDGGLMWLSHYHGGVWLLDWTAVLDGTATAPVALGYHVPHAGERPLPTAFRSRWITTFDAAKERPSVWDVVADGPYAYASDMTGGFYVLGR